ncbi:hypothetical protein B0T16DRAFT_450816 [Cercophora newfieldiana]|uniref:Uncharacterized protein n=1 Tax=Cercophora newfieldiana TaxID=92897 RepID=A0AA39YMC6_9PEZI|nr:hypothetical protein B0T16DRAFT_450816 [Cercophora newfieldiana]
MDRMNLRLLGLLGTDLGGQPHGDHKQELQNPRSPPESDILSSPPPILYAFAGKLPIGVVVVAGFQPSIAALPALPEHKPSPNMARSLPAIIAAGVALLPTLVFGAGTHMNLDPIEGYKGPIPFGDATINAPLDENCKETYIGFKYFAESFVPEMCAAACTSTTNYNRKHPDSNGEYMECKFFVAYVLYENDVAQGLYCSMYTREYDASYATNKGDGNMSMRNGHGWVRDPETCTTKPTTGPTTKPTTKPTTTPTTKPTIKPTTRSTRTPTIRTIVITRTRTGRPGRPTTVTVTKPTTISLPGVTTTVSVSKGQTKTVTITESGVVTTVTKPTTRTLPGKTVTVDEYETVTVTIVTTSVFSVTMAIGSSVLTLCPTPTKTRTITKPTTTKPTTTSALCPLTLARVVRPAD